MRLPFMIMVGDDFVKINPHATLMSEHVILDPWNGSRYASRTQAERAVKVFGVEDAEVVELLSEMRQIVGKGQVFLK